MRSNDTHFRFRPASDFVWLTGEVCPDAVLLLRARGRAVEITLFAHEAEGRSSPAFFTDRQRGELWVGPQPTLAEISRRSGITRVRSLTELEGTLARPSRRRLRLLRGVDPALDARLPAARRLERERDAALASELSELRLRKDAGEVRALREAIDATKRSLEDVFRALPAATCERDLEAAFDRRARIEGNGVGYGTIVAAGANACVLHWTRNDSPLRRGQLVLVDAGVEGHGLYTADITRTFPVSGRFSRLQAEVYDWVHRAKEAAIAAVRPGAPFLAPHRAATAVLARALVSLGVLRCPLEEALDETRQLYKRYTLHGTSHMLGLDVHDCAKAPNSAYRHGALAPGMVLTIEPGLYFQRDDLTVPRALRGIGIRVEDDVLVTARGARNLSAHIPSERSAVERWMADVRRRG